MSLAKICASVGIELGTGCRPCRTGEVLRVGGGNWTATVPPGRSGHTYAIGEDFLAAWLEDARAAGWASFASERRAVTPGEVLRVAARYTLLGEKAFGPAPLALLSWFTPSGKLLARECLDPTPTKQDGWGLFERTVRVPQIAAWARLELGVPAGPGWGTLWDARVIWQPTQVEERHPLTVATVKIAIPPSPSIEGNLELMTEAVARAADARSASGRRAQFVCLSECLVDWGVGLPVAETAQPLDGPAVTALRHAAREHGIGICTSLYEKHHDTCYNTAVLIGPQGQMIGTYRKTHLPVAEYEAGVSPGQELPVFDTPFGCIGMIVCWDLWFPEPSRILALQGAEVIFVPLAGDGHIPHWDHVWRSRALDNGVYLITSANTSNTPSRVLSPSGEVLAETNQHMQVAIADLRFDEKNGQHWLSVGNAFGETALYLQQRRPELYATLTAPRGEVTRPSAKRAARLPHDYLLKRHAAEYREHLDVSPAP